MFYQTTHIGTSDYFKKEYGDNFSFPPHMHPCFEFITALSGEMHVSVDGIELSIHPGEALLIFPNQIHALHSTQCRHMLCIFSPKLVSAYSSAAVSVKPENGLYTPEKELLDRLDQLDDKSSNLEKKGLLYLLCDQFDRTAVYVPRSNDSGNLLESIFQFIEQNFANNCTLSALAKAIGYDYAYLSRYFKNHTGIAYNEYVNTYRLNHACYLLSNTNLSILNCALESGYTSLRSFNRNFKDRFGESPSQYLQSSRHAT